MGVRFPHQARFWFVCALVWVMALGAPSCARWAPARAYQVSGTNDAETSYQAVQDVLKAENYRVLERDDPTRTVKVRTHVDESSSSRVSTITISVADNGAVSLVPSGFLVRQDGTIHKRLDDELGNLEQNIAGRLAAGAPAAPTVAAGTVPAAEAGTAPANPGNSVPQAWLEPARDPAKWGPGNFTCLPLHIPVEDQASIALELSTGELANVTLSLAYDASLCRSPAACPVAEGCPALGIGDAQQVQALAQRLQAGQIGGAATLVYRGQPAAVIDLNQHGSIAQAMGGAGTAAPQQ